MKCSQIPKCFKEREDSDKYFKRPSSLLNLICDLAKELVHIWSQTKGSLNILPRSIANVLNSQACRGMSLLFQIGVFIYEMNLPKWTLIYVQGVLGQFKIMPF